MFKKETAEQLAKLFPNVKFRRAGSTSLTIDLFDQYKTDNPDEEAPCPFLDKEQGCILPPELKPFDCSIWPFRAVRVNKNLAVALTPTCPVFNKAPKEKLISLLQSGLGQKIIDYANENPDIIKESSDFLSDILYNPQM